MGTIEVLMMDDLRCPECGETGKLDVMLGAKLSLSDADETVGSASALCECKSCNHIAPIRCFNPAGDGCPELAAVDDVAKWPASVIGRITALMRHYAGLAGVKVHAVDEAETDAAYVAAARERYHRDGEVEFDEGATVSFGGDPGAYVQAWVWVPQEDVVTKKQ